MLLLPFCQIKSRLTRNFLKEGYMEKTGPKVSCLWVKKSSRDLPESHWFCLLHCFSPSFPISPPPILLTLQWDCKNCFLFLTLSLEGERRLLLRQRVGSSNCDEFWASIRTAHGRGHCHLTYVTSSLHSRERLLRSVGSHWITAGSCTSRTLWWGRDLTSDSCRQQCWGQDQSANSVLLLGFALL